ncbi:MAG TPA: hypothetical protein ENJ82_14585 [Bacteroidetes bacterium]|nr:hypothetical protein [Bacteroidota bacterium]
MKHSPEWKRLMSFMMEWHIESTSSPYNPHLYVSLVNGRYQLSTANAIYSYGDLYDNFLEAFAQMDLETADFQSVLLLGLGLGSIPTILENIHNKQYQYTAVEIDEEVIYLASKYTLPELASPMQVICADAALYCAQCKDTFDLIAIDIFLDDMIPDTFQQTPFLENTKKLLTDKGVLIYNHLAYTKEDKKQAKDFFEDTFKVVFPKAQILQTNGNRMMISNGRFLKPQH